MNENQGLICVIAIVLVITWHGCSLNNYQQIRHEEMIEYLDILTKDRSHENMLPRLLP